MKQLPLASLIAALSITALSHVAAAEAPPVPTEKTSPATTDNAAPSNLDKARDDKADEQSAKNEADDSNASAASKTYHKFKIDVAYVDMAYLVKHNEDFDRKREELKQEIDRAEKELQKTMDELRRKQREYDNATQNAAARLYQEIKTLKQKTEKTRQEKQKEFTEMEARIYKEINDRCRAEVARYAKENDIRAVRQWSSANEREVREIDKAGISPQNTADVIKRLNGYVVYQADENISVTNDITQQILKRLNHVQQENPDPPANPAESDAPAAAAADHKSRIDIAYIDMPYVFRNSDEFNQKRDEIRHELELTENKIKGMVDEIRRKQDDYSKASKSDAPRLYQELIELAQKTEKLKQEKRKEFLVAEARIYQQIFNHCQAEVARYAKENNIDVVRRWKPKDDRDSGSHDKAGTSKHNVTEIQQLLRQDVIYQADDRAPITNDISKEIVKRLNQNQHDQSASAASAPK